jgi:hypothetical protein
VFGISVVDQDHVLIALSNIDVCKYRLYLFQLKYLYELVTVWEREADGSNAILSSVTDNHVLVGCLKSAHVDMWDLGIREIVKQYERDGENWQWCHCVVAGKDGEYVVAPESSMWMCEV